MTGLSTKGPFQALAAPIVAAVLIILTGLGNFGIWQPTELRVAEAARGLASAQEVAASRPPAQLSAVRVGFSRFGASETGGRLPTALLAVLATLAVALSVWSASDARTAGIAGFAYATMPLTFMNARQMYGGGVAQSAFTLLFASIIVALYCRPPPEDKPLLQKLYPLRALLVLPAMMFAVSAGGALIGVVPALVGVGVVPLMRWRDEQPNQRNIGLGVFVAGAALALLAARAAVRLPLEHYSWLVGTGAESHPPSMLPTHDTLVEHVGHAVFPWTGLIAFGLARLVSPPPMEPREVGTEGSVVSRQDAWRESGMRLAALGTAIVAFGLQGFYYQQFGSIPFVAPAALAIAAAIAFRDAERSAIGWRVVTAGVTFFTLIMVRDYFQFPKSSYGALGLVDGGPNFPDGFRWSQENQPNKNVLQWLAAEKGHALTAIFTGTAPAEAYFMLMGLIYIIVALPALFQGAGTQRLFALSRPFTWLKEVEESAQQEADPHFASRIFLAHLRRWLAGSALALMAIFLGSALASPNMGTSQKTAFYVIGSIPLIVVAGTYTVLILWDAFAIAGQPSSPLSKVLGTRLGFTALGALLVAMVFTKLYIPALSEHLSPRGVWAVIKQVRRGEEPVARFGGTQEERANGYYADFPVTNLETEPEAVSWLRPSDANQRRFMIVDSRVFSSLNRAYRQAQPAASRQNIPVLDASNSNLYVAASTVGDRGSRNPLDQVVMTNDRLTTTNDHWHAHGRYEGSRFIAEPARFDDYLEFLGYNLDSKGQSFVPVGGSFKIKYHFRVLREIAGSWQIFIHVDGQCPRINGDHEPAGGRYPVRHWLAGDIIHDEQEITIPGYCRGGTYYVYMGFFQGDDRMRITGGDHDRENRVIAARVVVR